MLSRQEVWVISTHKCEVSVVVQLDSNALKPSKTRTVTRNRNMLLFYDLSLASLKPKITDTTD